MFREESRHSEREPGDHWPISQRLEFASDEACSQILVVGQTAATQLNGDYFEDIDECLDGGYRGPGCALNNDRKETSRVSRARTPNLSWQVTKGENMEGRLREAMHGRSSCLWASALHK